MPDRCASAAPAGDPKQGGLQGASGANGSQPGGFTGIAFGSSDVQATFEHLRERGVEFSQPPTRQEWGAMMAQFVGPDGNSFILHDNA